MKFSGKSCENLKKLGIKKKQEKFWENFVEFLKKFQSASYRKYRFFILNTAFYGACSQLDLSRNTLSEWAL